MDLIQKRTEARRAHDFATADKICENLMNNYGVTLDNRESIRRTGVSDPGSRQRIGGGGHAHGGCGGGSYQRDTSCDNSNIDEAVVMELSQQRTQARKF